MTIAEPTIKHFNREEYYRMAEIGMFEGQRVELILGEIITMSPQNNPHALTISIVNRWLNKNLSDEFTIRCQTPLVASDDTEPEPDFAVLAGPLESQKQHPTTALLVIEVADSTLHHDRRKADLYASRNIPDYWILNLQDRKLERFTVPAPNSKSRFRHRYASTMIFTLDQSIQPLQLPNPSHLHLPPISGRKLTGRDKINRKGAPMIIAEPHSPRRRFTREEYFRMADLGIFDNQRVERLDGEIIEMSPQREPHARAIMQLNEFFTRQIGPSCKLRCQMPLAIGNSDPESDIAIVTLPLPADHAPTFAALIVEVADSSLAFDRKKAGLYASAKVPEYWIVNLRNKTVERHLDPVDNPTSQWAAEYRTVSTLNLSQSIQPAVLQLRPFAISTLFEPE